MTKENREIIDRIREICLSTCDNKAYGGTYVIFTLDQLKEMIGLIHKLAEEPKSDKSSNESRDFTRGVDEKCEYVLLDTDQINYMDMISKIQDINFCFEN